MLCDTWKLEVLISLDILPREGIFCQLCDVDFRVLWIEEGWELELAHHHVEHGDQGVGEAVELPLAGEEDHKTHHEPNGQPDVGAEELGKLCSDRPCTVDMDYISYV